MQALLNTAKKILPESFLKKIRPIGHGFLAYLGAVRYKYPSRKMIVVGITGTSGKSTTVQLLAWILNSSGRKTGYITTVNFFDGNTDFPNKHGMSMPGRFMLQSELSAMADNSCKYAIVECTSEGLAQNRHKGIDFDLALMTNLAEAHIEAHGSFDNYRRAKFKLFQALINSRSKRVFKQKIIGTNLDDNEYGFHDQYLFLPADQKFGITFKDKRPDPTVVQKVYSGQALKTSQYKLQFELHGQEVSVNLPGEFNAYNALMAVAAASELGVSLKESAGALQSFGGVAGRMEIIANNKGAQIFLDYAPEPAGLQQALKTVSEMPHKKIIHVFGSTGGHRDVRKRFEFGKLSARYADLIIVTNDDVYDSDPQKIADDVCAGIKEEQQKGGRENVVRVILDRKEAIKNAVDSAGPGDILIVTGKGSEQFLVLPGNKRIEWDERKIIEESL